MSASLFGVIRQNWRLAIRAIHDLTNPGGRSPSGVGTSSWVALGRLNVIASAFTPAMLSYASTAAKWYQGVDLL